MPLANDKPCHSPPFYSEKLFLQALMLKQICWIVLSML
ncbi:hypothetical protein BN129_251 [Cronobacter sakazakii 701]|nr:hypothetical protein BN129_251 [Cronobacter sakazakii 701]